MDKTHFSNFFWSKRLFEIPIKYLIPLILLLSSFISGAISAKYHIYTASQSTRRLEIDRIKQKIVFFQNIVDALDKNQLSKLQLIITAMTAQDNLDLAWIANDKGTIIASSKQDILNQSLQSLRQHPSANFLIIESDIHQQKDESGKISFVGKNKQILLAHYPIRLQDTIGNIFLRYDLSPLLDDIRQRKIVQVLVSLSVTNGLFILALFWIYALFWHKLLFLIKKALEIGNGNYHARTNLTGNDELSQIGQVIDFMADRMAHHRASLINKEQNVMALLHEGIISYNQQGQILACNDMAAYFIGLGKDEVIHNKIDSLPWEFVDEQGNPSSLSAKLNDNLFSNDQSHEILLGLVCAGESTKWLTFYNYQIDDPDSDTNVINTISFSDITERMNSQLLIKQSNIHLQTLTLVRHAALYTESEQLFLEKVCEIISSIMQHKLVWVGYISDNDHESIKIISVDGLDRFFKEEINKHKGEHLLVSGNAIKYIASGKPIIIHSHDATFEIWQPLANQFKFSSIIASPLIIQGNTIGCLYVYSEQDNSFSDGDLNFFENLANDISFAIESLRQKQLRQKIEIDLRNSEQQFREMFQQHSAIMLLLDPNDNGRIIDVNLAAQRYYGYSSSQLLGKKLSDINQLSQKENQVIIDDIEENRHHSKVFKHRLQDGSIRDVEVFSKIILIANKPVLFSIIFDITERKIAEKNLLRSEEKFRNSFNTAPVGMALININGSIADANLSLSTMLGYAIPELIGMNLDSISHPEDIAKDKKEFKKLLAGIIPTYRLEKRYLRKNKKQIWGLLGMSIIRDENQEILYIIAMIQDINDRKEFELKLIESESKIRAISDNIPGAIYTLKHSKDKNIEFLFISAGIFDITGYSSNHFINDYNIFLKGIVSDDIEDYKIAFQKSSIEKIPLTHEFRFQRRDGRIVWLSIKAKTDFNSNDDIIWRGLMLDITMDKELAEQLRQAKEQAENANKAKSVFLANMSHEIRTPMNAILGFSEILHNEIDSPTQRSYLDSVLVSGRALLQIINDILDLSRIEAGKVIIHNEPFSLQQLLVEIDSLFLLKAKEKGLNFNINIPKYFPHFILLDELRIRQVLINLIGNAIKFTEHGQVEINVIIDHIHEKMNKIDFRIIVSDSGIGIHEKDLDRIFDSFERGEEQDKKEYGGTGLGLAISKNLISMMGGTIKAQSEFGHGSDFFIVFSLVKTISKINSDKETPFKPITHNILFKNQTILVIDDVAENRILLRHFLKRQPLTIHEARNGIQGLRWCRHQHADLILLDLRMPKLDGFETLKRLRQIPHYQNTPVIAFTASGFREKHSQLITEGFDDILIKPITYHNIISVLKKYLDFYDTEEPQKLEINQNIEASQTAKMSNTTRDASANASFSFEHIESILHQAHQILLPLWQRAKEENRLSQIEFLATRILDVSDQWPPLLEFAQKLSNATEAYDIETIEQLMASFGELMETLTNKQAEASSNFL